VTVAAAAAAVNPRASEGGVVSGARELFWGGNPE
jgi:hypothetical protein